MKALLDIERAKQKRKQDLMAAQRAEKERMDAKGRRRREQRREEVRTCVQASNLLSVCALSVADFHRRSLVHSVCAFDVFFVCIACAQHNEILVCACLPYHCCQVEFLHMQEQDLLKEKLGLEEEEDYGIRVGLGVTAPLGGRMGVGKVGR